MPVEYLRIGEVAALLGVNPQTVRRYAEQGKLAVIVLPSGHRRFAREDVERLLEKKAS